MSTKPETRSSSHEFKPSVTPPGMQKGVEGNLGSPHPDPQQPPASTRVAESKADPQSGQHGDKANPSSAEQEPRLNEATKTQQATERQQSHSEPLDDKARQAQAERQRSGPPATPEDEPGLAEPAPKPAAGKKGDTVTVRFHSQYDNGVTDVSATMGELADGGVDVPAYTVRMQVLST